MQGPSHALDPRRDIRLSSRGIQTVTPPSKGRTFSYISEEIGVCREVIQRELSALGIATSHIKSERRVRRGKGFWRSFDQ